MYYACTHVEKEVVEDDFQRGEQPKTVALVMDEGVNIKAKTLPDLLRRIEDYFCLEGLVESVRRPPEHEGMDRVTALHYERQETDAGEEPREGEVRDWREGRQTLFTARWVFHIEKRVVSPVDFKDFVEAGIKLDGQ
jgi:hypothetical protein